MHNLRQDGFRAEAEEVEKFIDSLDQQVFQHTVDSVRKLFRDINADLLRRFTLLFKKEESGLRNRDFRQIPEDQIRELWQRARNLLDQLISTEFKYVKLPKQPLSQSLLCKL